MHILSTRVATLQFTLTSNKIVVENNEKGFKSKDIYAICDVGRSTKTKVCGYIGEFS